jgi:redox-sensitive bicupin YhaK (pirin superfamily)
MLTLRKAEERGVTRLGWLDSRHSFSFGRYYDPAAMGFGPLRVINDDRVAPGGGFGTHGHNDMEIITLVLDGALEHRDSLGTGSVIGPGEVQRMSAGSGILHSEFNASAVKPVHFLQIWIEPNETGGAPGYAQQTIEPDAARGKLVKVVSPTGENGTIAIRQDASLSLGRLAQGDEVTHPIAPGRAAYVHVASGEVRLDDVALQAGDGARILDQAAIKLTGIDHAQVLVFDLDPKG